MDDHVCRLCGERGVNISLCGDCDGSGWREEPFLSTVAMGVETSEEAIARITSGGPKLSSMDAILGLSGAMKKAASDG